MSSEKIAAKLVDLWGENCEEGDFVFLSKKEPESGNWVDRSFVVNDNLEAGITNWIDQNPPEKYHLYFCPLPFKIPRRRKKNVKGSKYLWSDLDEVDISSLPIKPSIYWESSPGRYQGLWELDRFIPPKQAEELSKELAYTLGADKSGWDLTQVLRIPGTKNHKYEGSPSVGETIETDEVYALSDLPSDNKKDEEEEEKNTTDNLEANKILAKYKAKIPRKALQLLLTKKTEVGKRSDILWYLEHTLLDVGLNPPEIFHLIKNSAWNKYAGRADEEERLTTELKKILEGRMEDEKPSPQPSLEDGLGLTISSYGDLMSSIASEPGWLVEGFWTRESHGIVAGEPKAFKSIMTLDLAISIASGQPFLGHFPVYHPGPVLIVQNENSDWIMKDRVHKIITHKGLTGKVKQKKHRELEVTFPPTLPIHFINQQGFQFGDPIHCEIVEKAIREVEPVLVIFDPLYLMFEGDLNTSKDLSPALTWLLKLKQQYNTAVVLVHHWNKGGQSPRGGQRMLGSTTLHGWVESAWYLKVSNNGGESKEEDNDDVFVDRPSGEPVSLIIEREFRGAGTYPKVESTIKMGKPGDPLYKIDMKKHVGKGHKSITPDLKSEILNIIEMSTSTVSQRRLAEETGAGRRAIKEVLTELIENGQIEKGQNKGVQLKEKEVK